MYTEEVRRRILLGAELQKIKAEFGQARYFARVHELDFTRNNASGLVRIAMRLGAEPEKLSEKIERVISLKLPWDMIIIACGDTCANMSIPEEILWKFFDSYSPPRYRSEYPSLEEGRQRLKEMLCEYWESQNGHHPQTEFPVSPNGTIEEALRLLKHSLGEAYRYAQVLEESL